MRPPVGGGSGRLGQVTGSQRWKCVREALERVTDTLSSPEIALREAGRQVGREEGAWGQGPCCPAGEEVPSVVTGGSGAWAWDLAVGPQEWPAPVLGGMQAVQLRRRGLTHPEALREPRGRGPPARPGLRHLDRRLPPAAGQGAGGQGSRKGPGHLRLGLPGAPRLEGPAGPAALADSVSQSPGCTEQEAGEF